MLKTIIKKIITRLLEISNSGRKLRYGYRIYSKMKYDSESSRSEFIINNWHRFWIANPWKDKALQMASLLRKVDVEPIENDNFFYSIDWFKALPCRKRIFDNYTIDYANVVNRSLKEKKHFLEEQHNDFSEDMLIIIDALQDYYEKVCCSKLYSGKYSRAIEAICSLFERSSHTFYEGLERILFINQFLWQTGHRLNGLGHLDWILIDLYRNDIKEKKLTEEQAYGFVKDFFRALHAHFYLKSNALSGDTGQIIILGGLAEDGTYICNELTELFIKVSMELKLPDPKILLRCSSKMPDRLIRLALECISTGIGAPLLSNDDVVIPAMVSLGYDVSDAHCYAAAACWEPLIPDCSCDASNVALFNFADPFMEMSDSPEFCNISSTDELLGIYHKYLKKYTKKLLSPLIKLQFEDALLMSLFSNTAMERQHDITKGGAKYQNFGLTSVGMGTVVNSILNIQDIVFKQKKYTLHELNIIRKNNYEQNESLQQTLKKHMPCYGCDDDEVIILTRQIMNMASIEFEKYKTKSGGRFKLGLSAPSYIDGGKNTGASFDGRKSGEPFNVHISASTALPATALLHFSMKLDYSGNRVNGNVVDFMVAPDTLNKNFDKYFSLVKAAITGGVFQLQMNVVSSGTLIAARANPKLFPELIVRVWGFSAYFNDLPDEYKDVLIERALESEKAS